MGTRGFVTIATGAYEYSQMAYNLLRSYRRFSNGMYPFAVITDKSNELLDEFDQVILLKNTGHSFIDKLHIFDMAPYDETIFIDADCLAYGDLSKYFDYFAESDDVSCPGEIFPRDSQRGWFRTEDTAEYQDRIDYTVWLHGGIYYVRKTQKVLEFYQTCKQLEKDYKRLFFRFKYLTEPADEPIVALAMAIHHMKPTPPRPEILAFYRDSVIKNIDIVSGKLSYHVGCGDTEHGLLVHWATSNTRKALYKTEAQKLQWACSQPGSVNKLSVCQKIYWKMYYYKLACQDKLKKK